MPVERVFPIDNLLLTLPPPTEMDIEWIGQEEVIHQLMAAWMVLDEKDLQTFGFHHRLPFWELPWYPRAPRTPQ